MKIGSRTVPITSGYSSGNHPVFPNYEQLLPKANINTTVFFLLFFILIEIFFVKYFYNDIYIINIIFFVDSFKNWFLVNYFFENSYCYSFFQLSRSSTARGDHYRTPQAAATPLIDPQRFSTVTQAMNYTSGTNISNYGSAGLHIDSQNLPLPPPQLASVEQYRISGN